MPVIGSNRYYGMGGGRAFSSGGGGGEDEKDYEVSYDHYPTSTRPGCTHISTAEPGESLHLNGLGLLAKGEKDHNGGEVEEGEHVVGRLLGEDVYYPVVEGVPNDEEGVMEKYAAVPNSVGGFDLSHYSHSANTTELMYYDTSPTIQYWNNRLVQTFISLKIM